MEDLPLEDLTRLEDDSLYASGMHIVQKILQEMATMGRTRKTANDDQTDPPQKHNDGTTRRGHNTVPVRRPGRTRGDLGAQLQESPTFPDLADRRVGVLCATTNNFEGCELLGLEIRWQKAKTEGSSE